MSKPDRQDKVDEVINDIDDIKTTVEELQDDAPADEQEPLEKLKSALDRATDATEEIEDRRD